MQVVNVLRDVVAEEDDVACLFTTIAAAPAINTISAFAIASGCTR